MFKKILVPIDGSEPSYRALNFAVDLAEKYSAELTLLSVAQPFVITPQYIPQPMLTPILTQRYDEEIEGAHKKMLSKAFEEAQKVDPEIKISKMLINGRPADKIIEISKKQGFDLIVIGSRGLGGVKEFFLGSVSDRVADEASCPVLIVK